MLMYKDEMTPKERTLAYLNGEEVDRLPCRLLFEETAAVYAGINVKEYYFNADKMLEAETFKVRELGGESSGINVTLRGMGEALGSQIAYCDDRASYVMEPILKDYSMLDHLDVINPYKDGRLPIIIEAMSKIKEALGDEVMVSSGVSGPISAAHSVRGAQNILRDVVRAPEKLMNLLDFMVECNLAFVKAMYETNGISCGIGDPLTSSTLINPKQFQRMIFPALQKLVDGIYKITGEKPSLHICGKSRENWESIKTLNISTFSLDNCEDLEMAKKVFGDKVLLIGNVDPVSVVRNGTIEEIYENVRLGIEKAGDSPSGYFVATGCDIPTGASVESIKAVTDATRKYGRGYRLNNKRNDGNQ